MSAVWAAPTSTSVPGAIESIRDVSGRQAPVHAHVVDDHVVDATITAIAQMNGIL
jgi:hypothetical protein